MTDTLFADVSEFQVPVTDDYPYQVLSIRSNDGTYRDHKFAQNYAWMCSALDSGRLELGIVYFYWRSNWADCVNTMKDMIGNPHPKIAIMIDVESGGNPSGDQSDGINRAYWDLADWLGNKLRVFGYANRNDFFNMWRIRPDGLRVIGAGYGVNPNLPGQLAHQYTDGVYSSVYKRELHSHTDDMLTRRLNASLSLGCSPFGPCDMNSADGMSPQDMASALGVGGPVPNAINDVQAVSPWLGDRITVGENVCPDGIGRWAQFQNGYIYWSPGTGAHPIPNSLFERYATLNWEAGSLGYPVKDNAAVTGGECQAFQGGYLYHQDGQPVYWVHGAILNSWVTAGYEKSSLGWPTSDESPYGDGTVQTFTNGSIYWSPTGVVTITNSAPVKTTRRRRSKETK